jgi:hypothetical protein
LITIKPGKTLKGFEFFIPGQKNRCRVRFFKG